VLGKKGGDYQAAPVTTTVTMIPATLSMSCKSPRNMAYKDMNKTLELDLLIL
jgi:hypothetical protein